MKNVPGLYFVSPDTPKSIKHSLLHLRQPGCHVPIVPDVVSGTRAGFRSMALRPRLSTGVLVSDDVVKVTYLIVPIITRNIFFA